MDDNRLIDRAEWQHEYSLRVFIFLNKRCQFLSCILSYQPLNSTSILFHWKYLLNIHVIPEINVYISSSKQSVNRIQTFTPSYKCVDLKWKHYYSPWLPSWEYIKLKILRSVQKLNRKMFNSLTTKHPGNVFNKWHWTMYTVIAELGYYQTTIKLPSNLWYNWHFFFLLLLFLGGGKDGRVGNIWCAPLESNEYWIKYELTLKSAEVFKFWWLTLTLDLF